MKKLITLLATAGMIVSTMPVQAAAVSASPGQLIKGSMSTVYYYGTDGGRYVFPTEKTYKTWYSDYSQVVTISDVELSSIALKGNVTYKPGVKMIKITTDPKVYAISSGGVLRWVKTEEIAIALYGTNWNKMVEDVPDPFFVNYKYGTPIERAAEFNPSGETAAASSIWKDKQLPTPSN